MSKESFKSFVRQNTNLINYVNNGSMTWQKFYDMYELYGDSSDIWNKYSGLTNQISNRTSFLGDTSLKDLFNMVKQVDLNSVKNGIEGIQKAVTLVQDLQMSKTEKSKYKPRPMYKYFED